jgi:hypothetical protein
MACSNAKLKSDGDKASPSFSPFRMGNLSTGTLHENIFLHIISVW